VSFLIPVLVQRLVQLSHHGARSLTALGPDIVPPPGAVYTLVVMRHGQSTWNKANRFIGWTDTALTEEGLLEAQIAGKVTNFMHSIRTYTLVFVIGTAEGRLPIRRMLHVVFEARNKDCVACVRRA
jgi:hypothetical protein